MFGDIHICQFPLTSGEVGKPRPVLTLFDLGLDVLICRITSVLRNGTGPATAAILRPSSSSICGS